VDLVDGIAAIENATERAIEPGEQVHHRLPVSPHQRDEHLVFR
jgi:hypothetical protein